VSEWHVRLVCKLGISEGRSVVAENCEAKNEKQHTKNVESEELMNKLLKRSEIVNNEKFFHIT
jgi:hypothetical protein